MQQPEARRHLLEVRGLTKTRTQGRWWQQKFEVRALDHVDLSLDAGRTLAVVGESGAGKTTLAMCLVGLDHADAGEIWFDGRSLFDADKKRWVCAGQDIQLIFQDSAGALSPRMSAEEVIAEPLIIRGKGSRKERHERAIEAMEQVGLSAAWCNRRPHELSGGQRQRLAIARALVSEARLLILDEAMAGLDLSIQGQIMNLLLDLQAARGWSYLYISHNLALVDRVADEVLVLRQGRVAAKTRSAGSLAPRPDRKLTSKELSLGAHTGA